MTLALKIEGHDDALIGISDVWDSSGCKEERFIYNGETIAATLVAGGMTMEDAMEFIDFNIEGSYVGPNTPIIVWPTYGEEE